MSKQTDKEIKALQLEMKQISRTTSILNENQVQKIFNTTPARYQYTRPAKGGGQWSYVRASYVRRALDGIFGFNWSFDIETSLSEAFEIAKLTKMCVVKGVLTCRTKVDGQWIEIKKVQFGRAEIKFKKNSTELLDFGNDMKAASSDALKKCASLIGIAADVYDPDEFQEIKIIGADDNSEKQENTSKELEKAKQVLNTQSKEVPNDKAA